MRLTPPIAATYTVIAVATIHASTHPDFWRPQRALQRLIESELAQLLLRLCSLAVTIEHVLVEPADELNSG
jgi:hypothetical protein